MSGELLSGEVEAQVVVPPRAVVAARTGRSPASDGGFSIPAVVWQLGGLAALFALGWAYELRRWP